MDRSQWDIERCGADFDFASFKREDDDAFDAVDGLIAGVVLWAMGRLALPYRAYQFDLRAIEIHSLA